MGETSSFKKLAGSWALTAVIAVVLVFTMSRTLHFLQVTLPPSMQPLAYLGLACFDIGALGWLLYATLSAEGVMQRLLSYIMIGVCFIGVGTTVIADIMLSSVANGVQAKLPPDLSTITLWVVSIIVVANVAAFFLVHLFSPKHLRHFATQQAKDHIISQSHKAIIDASADIAPFVANQVAEQWRKQVVVEMLGYLPASNKNLSLPPANVVESTVSGNQETVTNKNLTSTPAFSQPDLSQYWSSSSNTQQQAPAQNVKKKPLATLRKGIVDLLS